MSDATPPSGPAGGQTPKGEPERPPSAHRPVLSEPRVERRRGGGLSAAWLIPVIALVIAGVMAWRYYDGLGPRIEILLRSGSGIEPGRTAIRYRDVEIGVIEDLAFSKDFSHVIATAQMDRRITSRLTDRAAFWVVRPQISASGVAGLETVLSGVYLGADLGSAGEGKPTRRFEALPEPPLTPSDTPGRRFKLFAAQGASAAPGSPVFYKSIEVGRVETKRLSDDFSVIEYEIFVRAPHDQRIATNTRFWDASGFNLELGAEGVRVEAPSVVSILRGGVAFDGVGPPPIGGGEVDEGRAFDLYRNETAARDSLFEAPGEELRMTVVFEESVRGLAIGAPVEYRGLQIGSVEDVALRVSDTLGGAEIVTTIVLQPRRIGIGHLTEDDVLAFFRRSVERGLRARLAVGSIVTGAAYVQFVDLPQARAAELDVAASPYPRMPSVPSQLGMLKGSVDEILARIEALPVEELIANASGFLENLRTLTGGEAAQGLPGDLAETVASAKRMIRALEDAKAGEAVTATLADVRKAVASVEATAAELPAVARRLSALAASAEQAAATLAEGGSLNRAGLAALRDVQNAARAIKSLASTIERDPNSIILGR